MKFSLSVVILALAASQAMAVIPIPVKECTKSVIVQPSDSDGCDLFASRHNTTFENMRKWNEKLRGDCANLDVGHPICVSVTKAAPTTAPATNGTATTTASTVSTTKASNSTTTLPTTTTSNPANATNPATDKKSNDATGSKSSMVLAAAGVVLSVAYMF
ncbi:hypothetical protein BGZ80_001820 [Entomortierella chlamydospora]|uniref:LysM domain-containing protein n=1 Tax=Entomortierella chlamydospora TaxID=101097 RepID=A0A9P6SXI7_9FUNG|nr:hypothetical protein BGZ80_001820 [Entomortierella chlamydospora]